MLKVRKCWVLTGFFLLAASAAYGAVDRDSPLVHPLLCYATSVNTPEDLYGPENVFDGDTATYWATMPGAAPDEGIYFSFPQPMMIEEMRITTVPGSRDFADVEYIQVYFNGLEGGLRRPGASLYFYGPVKSIFVKIVETESMHYDEQGIRYERDVPAAISEITIDVENAGGEVVPLRIVPLTEVAGSVRASSSLEPATAYGPDFLFDSRPAFGWADGNPGENGINEYLEFRTEEPVRIEKIRLWNGYHRSGTHYAHNERVKEFSFGPWGQDPEVFDIEDVMEPLVIPLRYPVEGDRFMLDVLDVYPGEVYRDLVISELQFFNGDEWFVIDTGNDEERKNGILEWARGCDAGAFIDKQLFASEYHDSEYESSDYTSQSIVIRSNGSFVLWYRFDSWELPGERMYADGNWETLDDSRIRIFGRMHRLGSYDEDIYDPYAGTWSDQGDRLDRMTIFSDTLSFGPGWMSSSKGLFEDFSF